MTDRLDVIKTTWNVPAKQPRPPAAGRDDVVWLVGEVERLRAEVKEWRSKNPTDDLWRVRLEQAEDEVERLREALADIARGDYSDPLCQRTPEQRAREALASKP
jgi:hypothetical protein